MKIILLCVLLSACTTVNVTTDDVVIIFEVTCNEIPGVSSIDNNSVE